MKRYLLFDLDGTLTDPKVGITTSVQYALADQGIDEPDIDKLEPFIGPPLKDSFMEFYHMTEEQADRAIAKYRERFKDIGIFENELYGGIHDLLRTMKAGGMHMAVVSSKPTVYVERILKHFKLDPYFEVVLGSELDGTRVKKAQVMAEVLRKFYGDQPINHDEIYMIGDRKYDIEAARVVHIESIGVAYGYGSMEELKEAKADYIVKSVAELKKLLMREVEEVKRMDEVHKAQQPGARKPQNQGMKALWRVLLPYVLFILVRTAVGILMSVIFQSLSKNPSIAQYIMIEDENGMSLTGLAGIIAQIASYGMAGVMIMRYADPMITQAAEEAHLTHLKPEPRKSYVLLGLVTVGSVVALTTFMDALGMTNLAESYRALHGTPYDVPILLGLISFGFCTPLAEELMFRGIVYNGVKKFMSPRMSLVMSAVFFAYSTGYSIQMLYGLMLGFLLTYAYEYFADIRVAVAAHVAANVLSYLLNYTLLTQAPIYNWPVCVVSLAVTCVSLFLLMKAKKVY